MNTDHTPGRRPRLGLSLAIAFALGSGAVGVAAQPAAAVIIVPPGCGSYSGQPLPPGWHSKTTAATPRRSGTS